MDDPEKKKIVLGSLLNAAGAAAKRVISSYSPEKTYKANMKALKACKAAPLEECATLLGFTCREADKKLYRNITILTDRIILKIEALFEIHCDDCHETYSNTLEDEPPLTCRLCMQGSHNCDPVKEKMKTLKPIMEAENLPSGMVWLCHECKKKNDLSFLQPVMPTTLANNQGAENNPEEDDIDKDEEEEEEEEEERRISPRRGRDLNDAIPKDAIPKDVTSKENVCEMYKRRQCPHGRTGKTLVEGLPCSKSHPLVAADFVITDQNQVLVATEAKIAAIGTHVSVDIPLQMDGVYRRTHALSSTLKVQCAQLMYLPQRKGKTTHG
jgi:hypothetical protein